MNIYFYQFFVKMRVVILLAVASILFAAPQAIAQQPISWATSPALPSDTYAWVEGGAVELEVPKALVTSGTPTYRLEIKTAQGYRDVSWFSVDTSDSAHNDIKGTVPTDSAGNWAEFYYIAEVTNGDVTHKIQTVVDFVCYDDPEFTDSTIADQLYTKNQAITALTLPAVHTFVFPIGTHGYRGFHRKISYALSPALPSGLSFDETTRQITGTPIVVFNETEFTYTVTDGSTTASENHFQRSIAGQDPVSKDLTFKISVTEASQADLIPVLSSEERLLLGGFLTFDTLIFNELHNGSNDANDWLELRNVSNIDIPLENWRLTVQTGSGTAVVPFPAGTVIPTGEVLLITNTAIAPAAVVVETFALPQSEFALILRSPTAFGDIAGNYFQTEKERPETAPELTSDTVWERVEATTSGYRAEAWAASTHRNGLGSPGYQPSVLPGDLNNDGLLNILDLVLVASQFGTTGITAADLNGDNTVDIRDLVLVANVSNNVGAAPTAKQSAAATVNTWLQLARQNASSTVQTSLPEGFSYAHGIQVLEQLVRALTPETTALLANYPNPFNPETWIPYQLAKATDVAITIYASNGSVVRTLALGHRDAGMYKNRNQAAYWDGRNELGETVASGIYFYTLAAGNFKATRRMLILK